MWSQTFASLQSAFLPSHKDLDSQCMPSTTLQDSVVLRGPNGFKLNHDFRKVSRRSPQQFSMDNNRGRWCSCNSGKRMATHGPTGLRIAANCPAWVWRNIDSRGTLVYMQSCNDKVKAIMNNPLHDELPEAGASRRKIDRVRVAIKSCFTSRPVSRLLILIVLRSHFFGLCMDCSFSTPEFIENVKLYDSLKRCTRQVSSWCSWHC